MTIPMTRGRSKSRRNRVVCQKDTWGRSPMSCVCVIANAASLKPLWAPLLEVGRSKRFWVISMEFTMAAALGLVALVLPLADFFKLSLAFFWIVGFASATQDTCADGVFMTTVSKTDQARYSGLQGMCWNLGAVIASGLLVSLTGRPNAITAPRFQHMP